MGEASTRRDDDDDAEDAEDVSPVRPFDHRAIVALSPQGGSPPLIFGGTATTPVRGPYRRSSERWRNGRTNLGADDDDDDADAPTTNPARWIPNPARDARGDGVTRQRRRHRPQDPRRYRRVHVQEARVDAK
jgi:hypothetical protein